MKILVFADFHGSVSSLRLAATISRGIQPNKTVICGDLFGWSSPSEVASAVSEMQGVPYLIRGNNDLSAGESLLPCEMEDYALMYHFGRTLFFTHGDRYNAGRVPPLLKEGDALVYGHTHTGRLFKRDGIYACNVGSLARPRDGQPCYLLLDEVGATLHAPDGETLSQMDWQ